MIDRTEPETCGNCRYGKRVELNVAECHGIPPTPVPMGGGVDAFGRQAIQMNLFRARLPANEPACALWKFKAQLIDLSAASA